MSSNWISKWPAKTSSQQYPKPSLELLEDRTAPSVDIAYGGGPTIPHVQVNNIVVGPQPVDTTVLMQDLVRDYLPLLGPYYGIGAGTLRSSLYVPPMPGNPSILQLQAFIVQAINSGALPPPDGNQVYFIFLAPGQSVSVLAGTDAVGFHSHFVVIRDASGYHLPTAVPFGTSLIPVYFAVSFGTTNSVSVTASHELAESVTDPAGSGYRDAANLLGGEVADIYEFLPPFILDGFPVSLLSGPQGQQIRAAGESAAVDALQEFFALILEEAETLAFRSLSAIDPQLLREAQAAAAAVYANPFYGTAQGQIGMFFGEELCASWFSQ